MIFSLIVTHELFGWTDDDDRQWWQKNHLQPWPTGWLGELKSPVCDQKQKTCAESRPLKSSAVSSSMGVQMGVEFESRPNPNKPEAEWRPKNKTSVFKNVTKCCIMLKDLTKWKSLYYGRGLGPNLFFWVLTFFSKNSDFFLWILTFFWKSKN